MKKNHCKSSLFIAFLFTIAIFTLSCGGGGGGGGGTNPPPPTSSITYTGLTTQAAVSESNATDLSEGAYAGADLAVSLGSTVSVVASQGKENRNGLSLPIQLPQIFENSLNKIDWKTGKITVGAMQSESGTFVGNCGGTGSYSLTYDDQTGNFTGQFAYNNYCEDNITLSGSVSISGQININTLDFITFNFSFDNVTLTMGADSLTIKGDIHVYVSSASVTITENMLLKNNANNKVYWCKDYNLTITKGGNYNDITLSGTYYHPDYGYVTISTPTPFRIYTVDTTPSSGVLRLTGSGNTSAVLTALNSSAYCIQADTNGCGNYEWDSGVLCYGGGCGSWTGTKQFGSDSSDYGRGVAVDAIGNVYVTGYTHGNMDENTNAGVYDMFLTKYFASGMHLWTRQIGTWSNEYGYGVAVDTSVNVYVTGYTYGNMDGNTSAGGDDMFLVKYDAAGTKQWTQQLGTSSDDYGYGVAVDASGNVYVTGFTWGGLDGNTSAGSGDMFLVKYDAAGTKQWTRQLGTTSYDAGRGIAVDASGNVYVTGYTDGGLDGNIGAGGDDMFLVKYDAAGTKQWTRQLGTNQTDQGYGVAVDASGNVYVTGYTDGGLDGNTSAGYQDMFLVKYDAAGTKQWTRQLGTNQTDQGYGVAVDASGNVYVTGYTYGSLDGNISAGSTDMFLVKYDAAGTKQWTRQLGTWSGDFGYGVAVDASGNVYVTGTTGGGLDGNFGRYDDAFLVKYDANGVKQ